MREREIEAYLVKRVQAMGGEVRKVQFIGRRGAPDRLVMLPAVVIDVDGKPVIGFSDRGVSTRQARTFWVELKAPGKVGEPHQLREHERMRAMGQRVFVIDSLAGVDGLLS